jgi:nitrous oxidase accessory protein
MKALTLLILIVLLPAYPLTQQVNNLQAVVDAAEPGSVIVLQPGIYRGPVRIWKPLTIIGISGAVVDGGGVGDVVLVESDNVVLKGLKVVNSYTDVAFEPAGIKVSGSKNVTISGNIIDRVIHGIYIVNSTNVSIGGNIITSFAERDISDRGHGVYLWYTRNTYVFNNTINHVKDGVYSDHSYNIVLRNNVVTGSRYGTHLMYTTDHVIVGNEYRNNLVGMALMYSCMIHVEGNVVRENRGTSVSEGVFLRESCNVYLIKNIIVGNAVGINIVATPYPQDGRLAVRENIVAFNNIGLMADIWASGVIEENDLLENAQQFYPTPGTSVSIVWRGNFWSNRKYQTGEKFLLIDPVEDLVDRYPLLRAFIYSPGYTALTMMKTVIELSPRVKAIDEAPSQAPHKQVGVSAGNLGLWPVAGAVLTFLPLTFFIMAWRNARGRA